MGSDQRGGAAGRQTPSPPEMSTAAVGTHPTRMHSSFVLYVISTNGNF